MIDKVFSVTLDNASSNASSMSKLIHKFLGYLGPDFESLHQENDNFRVLLH
jgi:hypothetical protein